MKTAIVSGATGFIGVHLCRELLENGYSVVALTRKNSPNIKRLSEKVTVIDCPMNKYGELVSLTADVFFHLAWEGSTGAGRQDEELQSKNACQTIAAIKAAKCNGCKRIVALGTVYEKLLPQIISASQYRQADFYLLSKQYAHTMGRQLALKIGVEFVWATIFHPIGKYIKSAQMMAYAIENFLQGTPPTFGPAQEPYDITAVENIALGLRLLAESDLSRDEYYIGSGQPKRLVNYLTETQKILNSSTNPKIGDRADDGMRFSFNWYDIAPLVKDTGYRPIISFEEAVLNTAEWLKNQMR